VAGDLTNLASGRARPQRIRPHWWAVLAVSLSLLALVAAATSDHSNGRGDKTASRGGQAAPHAPTSPPTSTPTTTTTTLPTTPPRAVTPTTSAPTVASVNAAGTTRVVTKASITAPATTTTTTAPAAKGSAIGAAPAQPAPQTLTGDLQQPDAASANYAFTGSGAMRISVSWSPTTTLSLFVSCPDGSQTAEGASSVAVVLPDANGACELTLKEALVQYNVVSYTLTIAPTGG
jgi:hypothetical protein